MTTYQPRPHLPMQPAWLCRNCAAPWPCGPAQLTLLEEYWGHSLALAFYMASCLHDAVNDLYSIGGTPNVQEMHNRFLGWLTLTRKTRRLEPYQP